MKDSLLNVTYRIFGYRLASKFHSLAIGGPENRIGAQCQFDSGEMLRFNSVVHPAAILIIGFIKRDFLEKLIRDNPGVMIIYRPYPDSEWADDPERRAAEHIERLAREIAPVADLIHAVLDGNEYVHAHQHDLHPLADRFMARFIQLSHTQLKKVPVVLNAATGNVGDDVAQIFPKMLLALQMYGGYVGFHEYDWPTMWRMHEQGIADGNEGMWHCLRWKRAARAIRAAMDGWCPQFIVTECGLDSHVIPELVDQPHKGFRDVYPEDLARSVEHYVESLDWYSQRFDDDLFAAIIFLCGGVSPWGPFDIAGTDVPDRIAQFPSVPIPPEPEPGPEPEPEPQPEPEPNGGEEMDELEKIKVYKWVEGVGHVECVSLEDKKALVEQKYGVAFRRAKVAPGQKVYRLMELWEKTGHSALITQVLDENGNPKANVDVAFYWPGAPDPPDPPTQVHLHDWYRNFVHGATNVNGDVGPGMGRGAYHGEGEGGPHAVWVRDADIPSDLCEKLGMLAGTFHDHLDQKFALTTGGAEPPGNGGNGAMKFVEVSRQEVTPADHSYIRLFPDESHDFHDTRGDMTSGSWQLEEPVHPKEVDGRPCIEFDTTYTENEDRTYLAYIQTPDGKALGGPFACAFKAGQKSIWNVTVSWQSETQPPGPTPPPTNLGDRIRTASQELNQIADEVDALKQVARVKLVMADGSEVEFQPAQSVASHVVTAVRSFFKF